MHKEQFFLTDNICFGKEYAKGGNQSSAEPPYQGVYPTQPICEKIPASTKGDLSKA